MTEWKVGDQIHGFANGYFGRDSYHCRVVEAVGLDWLVMRNTRGEVELILKKEADQIIDPMDKSHCEGFDDEPCNPQLTMIASTR